VTQRFTAARNPLLAPLCEGPVLRTAKLSTVRELYSSFPFWNSTQTFLPISLTSLEAIADNRLYI
jgi:hypothetical protein